MEYGVEVVTCGISNAMEIDDAFATEVFEAKQKYHKGDWGDTCEEDKKLNNEAVKNGDRIVALYKTSKGDIFIITECDRSATTILFAYEY